MMESAMSMMRSQTGKSGLEGLMEQKEKGSRRKKAALLD
jgi:hypothetical protein